MARPGKRATTILCPDLRAVLLCVSFPNSPFHPHTHTHTHNVLPFQPVQGLGKQSPDLTMSIGGEGAYLVSVLWGLTGLVLFFLVLRIYTRVVCLAQYGIDDNFYIFTCVMLVCYSSMATVAAEHGYGRNDLTPDEEARSTYFRSIAQTFSLLSTGASKATVGFFLLRLVYAMWMKIAIWFMMIFMGIMSILAAIFTWAACKPFPFTWDERIGGTCINTIPLSMILALGTIAADLFFAVLPWLFIWKLNAPRREKITLAASLSLGIFAAAAGAKRIMEVKGVRDVPVGVIVWSMVETSVTLVCVGIPVCRPLWTRHFSKWFQSKNSNYQAHDGDTPNAEQPIGLNTFGGGEMPGAHSDGSNGSSEKKGGRRSGGNKRRGPLSSLFASLAASTVVDRTVNKDHRTTASDSRSDEVELTEESGVVVDNKAFGADAVPSSRRSTTAADDGGDQYYHHSAAVPAAGRHPSHDGGPGGRDELKRSWIMGERGTMTSIDGDTARRTGANEDGITTHMSYEISRTKE